MCVSSTHLLTSQCSRTRLAATAMPCELTCPALPTFWQTEARGLLACTRLQQRDRDLRACACVTACPAHSIARASRDCRARCGLCDCQPGLRSRALGSPPITCRKRRTESRPGWYSKPALRIHRWHRKDHRRQRTGMATWSCTGSHYGTGLTHSMSKSHSCECLWLCVKMHAVWGCMLHGNLCVVVCGVCVPLQVPGMGPLMSPGMQRLLAVHQPHELGAVRQLRQLVCWVHVDASRRIWSHAPLSYPHLQHAMKSACRVGRGERLKHMRAEVY